MMKGGGAKLSEAVSPDTTARPLSRVRRSHELARPGDFASASATFWRDNAMGMAATIAFFAFLSLIPLVLLLLAFIGDLLQGSISATDVRHLFRAVVPGLSRHEFLQSYWYPVQHSKVTTKVLGVVSLLIGTTGLHDSVDWAVNRIWQAPVPRPFWVKKVRGFLVILWVVGFAIFSLWLTWLWTLVLGASHSQLLSDLGKVALVPSLALDIAIFGALYRFTPTVPVRTSAALIGGAVAALLWESSKILFGWWVLQVGTYNRVYGPLTASVIVMIWLWVSAMIFLYGACLSASVTRRRG
jgi:membrane protein